MVVFPSFLCISPYADSKLVPFSLIAVTTALNSGAVNLLPSILGGIFKCVAIIFLLSNRFLF